jgi:hypothetical protein
VTVWAIDAFVAATTVRGYSSAAPPEGVAARERKGENG